MAAILDKDDSLDLVKLAEGINKKLTFYSKPLFIRCLSHVEMTGKLESKIFERDRSNLRISLSDFWRGEPWSRRQKVLQSYAT